MNKPGWLVSQFAFLTLRELVNLTLRDGRRTACRYVNLGLPLDVPRGCKIRSTAVATGRLEVNISAKQGGGLC